MFNFNLQRKPFMKCQQTPETHFEKNKINLSEIERNKRKTLAL